MMQKNYLIFWAFTFLLSSSPCFGEENQTSPAPEKQLLAWKVPASKKSLIPDISLIGAMAGAAHRDDPANVEGTYPARTGFNFQGVELAVQSVVDPYVRGDVFAHFLEDEVEIEEAYLTTLSLPLGLQVRAGKMFARLGRVNTQHLEQWDFVDRPSVARQFFGDEGFAELGVELSELFPTPWFSELSVAMLQGENAGNFDGTRKTDFAYVGHWKNAVDLAQDLTWQMGLSGALGFNATAPGSRTQIYGVDGFLRWKPSERFGLKWQSEYFWRRRKSVVGLIDGGFYSQMVVQFARRWEAGVRADFAGMPSAAGFRQWGLTPAVTFLATEFFSLRGQYSLFDTQGAAHSQHAGFMQMIFNMGPHGAHSF